MLGAVHNGLVDRVERVVVAAAAAEEVTVDASAQVLALGLDAFPHEHAGALLAQRIAAHLGSDLKAHSC